MKLRLSETLMVCGGFLELVAMGLEWFDLIQLFYYYPEQFNLMGWQFLLQLTFTLIGICFLISPKYLGMTMRTGVIGALIIISIGTLVSFHLRILFGFEWYVETMIFIASFLTLIGSIIKYGEIKERLGKSKWTWE